VADDAVARYGGDDGDAQCRSFRAHGTENKFNDAHKLRHYSGHENRARLSPALLSTIVSELVVARLSRSSRRRSSWLFTVRCTSSSWQVRARPRSLRRAQPLAAGRLLVEQTTALERVVRQYILILDDEELLKDYARLRANFKANTSELSLQR